MIYDLIIFFFLVMTPADVLTEWLRIFSVFVYVVHFVVKVIEERLYSETKENNIVLYYR